jgi:hypothetical protein
MSKHVKVRVDPVEEKSAAPVAHEKPVVRETDPETEYVHTPGTVHINAYYGAVAEAKLKVQQAQSELDAAERALEDKKQSSRA